jgi:5-methyltetrahydropteroyltriglutamate--homocysteine methyltransferase
LDVFTDGEFRRGSFMGDLAEAVEGFILDTGEREWRGPGASTKRGAFGRVVGAKLRQTRRLTVHESVFLREHSPRDFKITIPSPSLLAFVAYKPGLTTRFYPARSDLLRALTEIISAEIKLLAGEGVPYIQLDAPVYTYYADPKFLDRMRLEGIDPDQSLEESIAADNTCLEAANGQEVTPGIHLCRGNSRSRWLAEGSYEPIAEKLFGSLEADRFLLEYDSERAGSFAPLRFVPKGKSVVLGLVTTKTGQLELQEELLRRIEEASAFVSLENLAISPQCGFASSVPGNLISYDEQRRQLELVADTARKVWRENR